MTSSTDEPTLDFADAFPDDVVSTSPPPDLDEPDEPTERPEGAVTPAAPHEEAERLDPQPLPMVLESGTEFDLESLRLRQFLRLLRIITRGASDVLDTTRLDLNSPEAFVQQFLGMVILSIPEAEEETIDFIKSMVKPRALTGDPKKDLPRVQELAEELDNPELTDTITIIQCVIETEGEDLRALGKRLQAMFAVAQKMGAAKPEDLSLIGGFSLAVDLIASEYGWTHPTILDMPIRTMRQTIAAIGLRQKQKRMYEAGLVEWQTKILAQFIANSVPLEKGQANPLAKAAEKIRLRMEDDTGQADTDVPMEEWIEKGSPTADNPVGSMEALMSGFRGGEK